MYGVLHIYSDHLKEYIEPLVNVERFIFFEATYAGLSRYLVAYSLEDNIEEIISIAEKLPRGIRPALASSMLVKKLPQKTLSLLSEGRHLIPEGIFKDAPLPRDTPAFKFISKRLLFPVPDVDDIIRIQAALEDRKALDARGFAEVKEYIRRLLGTYLAGILQEINTRRGKSKYKILTSHIRLKAIQDAKAEEKIMRPLENRDAIYKILSYTEKHIRKRDSRARKYVRGSENAAFLVFTRDSLNVAYVYEIMNELGKEGYDVKEIIVAYDSSSEDIAIRVSEPLKRLGDVRAKTTLIPETPGGIIKEYLGYLINRYERRGMKLFLDGRGGSPAAFLAILRNFRDRLVLPDR